MNNRSNGKWGRGVILAICLCCGFAAIWNQGGTAGTASTLDGPFFLPSSALVAASAQDALPAGFAVGNASCARRGCHGNVNDPAVERGGELTQYARHDPHSRGFGVLKGDLSLRILDHLVRQERFRKAESESDLQKDQSIAEGDRQTVIAERCLACHSYYHDKPAERHDSVKFDLGIGCETCHGPASGWLTEHYSKNWDQKTVAEKQALGMNNTKSLSDRAKLCSGCHVGDSKRDMNHDIIAAGHPRLNFEYAAYLSDLDPHWRKETRDKDFGAAVWKMGRLASALSALELLQDRARRAQAGHAPWPEFSEYNCFACHKQFVVNDGLFDPTKEVKAKESISSIPWGSWHFTSDDDDVRAATDPLRAVMERPLPNWEEVQKLCGEAMKTLAAQLQAIESKPPAAPNLANVKSEIDALTKQGAGLSRDWDRLAQSYLRLAAALDDPELKKQAQDQEASKALRAYAETLEFPKGFASPARNRQKEENQN